MYPLSLYVRTELYGAAVYSKALICLALVLTQPLMVKFPKRSILASLQRFSSFHV